MFRKIFKFFDRTEDKTRSKLSKYCQKIAREIIRLAIEHK